MDLEKIFSPYNPCIYMDCMGKIFFFHILIIGDALKALPKSAPFYKKGALACKLPLFKIGALS
jgi:hypothetical protein